MPCSSTWVVTRYSPTGDRATLEAGESTTKQSRSLEDQGEGTGRRTREKEQGEGAGRRQRDKDQISHRESAMQSYCY